MNVQQPWRLSKMHQRASVGAARAVVVVLVNHGAHQQLPHTPHNHCARSTRLNCLPGIASASASASIASALLWRVVVAILEKRTQQTTST
jgi:hypothetical protein